MRDNLAVQPTEGVGGWAKFWLGDRATAVRPPALSRGLWNRPWRQGTSASDQQSFQRRRSSLPCRSVEDGELLSPVVLHRLLLDPAGRLGLGVVSPGNASNDLAGLPMP